MWSDKNCSLYRAHKVLYTECPSWPGSLTPQPKISRVHPIIIFNLQVKFESDWTNTAVVCIMLTGLYTQSAQVDFDVWLHDPKSIGFLQVIGKKL